MLFLSAIGERLAVVSSKMMPLNGNKFREIRGQ